MSKYLVKLWVRETGLLHSEHLIDAADAATAIDDAKAAEQDVVNRDHLAGYTDQLKASVQDPDTLEGIPAPAERTPEDKLTDRIAELEANLAKFSAASAAAPVAAPVAAPAPATPFGVSGVSVAPSTLAPGSEVTAPPVTAPVYPADGGA